MALKYELDDQVIRYTTVSDVEFDQGTRTLENGLEAAKAKDPSQLWHILFDIRESNENRSSGELNFIAIIIGEHRSMLSGRCAIVVADPLHYGLGRMFATIMMNYQMMVEVKHDVEEAERWLRS